MKRLFNWQVILGVSLLILSAAVYYIHYLLFRDAHHIFLYLIGDIAFVFIEVLLVTMVLHQLLHQREKKAILEKLNMAIGAFFSDTGTELIKKVSVFTVGENAFSNGLLVNAAWTKKEFLKTHRLLGRTAFTVDARREPLEPVRDFLTEKRQFLLRLLENPNLLEHETFTDLLWAVFHLAEELAARRSLAGLPAADYQHLSGDIARAYRLLLIEWLKYMEHLENNYPYLFSLAVRTNPFDRSASVEIA